MTKHAGRVALVTGGARGIGAATVAALAADGWQVVAVDICANDPVLPYRLGSRDELERIAATAAAAGGDVRTFVADVRDPAALGDAVAQTETIFGRLDAAISCAGVIGGGRPQHEVPIDVEQAVLAVNLAGVLNLARASVPALLRRPAPRAGRFLAVASSAGTHGLPQLAAYCAAKAGVIGLVRALAAELAGTGITANTVSPGSTDTPILSESARLYGLASVQEFATQQAVRRLLEPAEIAAQLVHLASDAGAAFTGTDMHVDGGFSL